MSVILLRVRGGLDFSAHIVDEELVEPEVVTVFSKIIAIIVKFVPIIVMLIIARVIVIFIVIVVIIISI